MHHDTHTLLLATADERRATFLGDQLAADGFDVVIRHDHDAAMRAVERQFPDVIISDLRLPGGGALGIVESVRLGDRVAVRVDPGTPVVVLTEQDDALDRVRLLERGADDVLGPLLHYPELLARVRAVLRRTSTRGRQGLLRVGNLEIDPVSRVVQLAGEPLELSAKEYGLLSALASEPTRVFDKEELLRAVWGFRSTARTRTLDSHACRLRRKLRDRGAPYVINVWGVGYRLLDAPAGRVGAGIDRAPQLLAA